MNKMNKFVLAAAFAAAMAMPAYAQKAPATRDFVKKAEMTNLFEVKAGKIAQTKTMNSKVDKYARMIVNDHKQLATTLKLTIKDLKDVKLPTALDQAHQKLIRQLQAASGPEFLKTFKTQQVKGHKEGVALFKSYARNGSSIAVKKWARSSVAVLQKHLREAQNLPTAASAPTTGAGGQMDSGMSK